MTPFAIHLRLVRVIGKTTIEVFFHSRTMNTAAVLLDFVDVTGNIVYIARLNQIALQDLCHFTAFPSAWDALVFPRYRSFRARWGASEMFAVIRTLEVDLGF